MRALVLLLVLVAGMARAETVRLTSGEHDGFTRIVLELSEPSPWRVGRTPDGYVVQLGRDGIRFDLTQAFRNIPRSRLAAIWADPASGDLRLGIGCACHAMPFEFRENVIVVDIKDGPPPSGSSFEQSLDGLAMPKLAARGTRHPRARPSNDLPGSYDWTRLPAAPAAAAIGPALPSADLAAMRETLLVQLSRGQAQGLLDLTLPARDEQALVAASQPQGQIESRLGPGLLALTPTDQSPALNPVGEVCIETARLDLATWGDDRSFDQQLAEARGAMIGEFDRPDPEAVGRQVRLLLYFGFGLEARATLRALAANPPDSALLETMALIMDDEPVPPGNPFAGQEDCDTAAAMWAVLARPELRRADRADTAAVLRSFSALPLWLRRHLGPELAERFLAIGDTGTARAIHDAILRAPGNPGAGARLVTAKLELANGDPEQAVTEIENVAREAGPMLPQAMIDLVEARLAQGAAVDAASIEALGALAAEQDSGPLGPALRRALGLARASAGDFPAAFALSAAGDPNFDADLWPLLARSGPDSALLAAAVLAPADIPPTDRATHSRIATRLIDLGFPDAGLAWLPPPEGEAEMALLAARAELMRQDARATLRLLAGQTGAEAERLRAAAETQLGDTAAAAATLAAAGDAEGAERALWQARDWAAVAEDSDKPTLAAAAALAEPEVTLPAYLPAGTADDPITVPQRAAPLARGRALVEESAAARATLLSMLAAVPAPETRQP